MLGIWDVEDVGCLQCGMLPGYGILIYKMPRKNAKK